VHAFTFLSLVPKTNHILQARSPGKPKSSALSEMMPKISKNIVAGQCLSLLDEEAKENLESKMEKAFSKTMRAELKSTCLLEAHGTKAQDALRDHFTACIEDTASMRHPLLVKSTMVSAFSHTHSTLCNNYVLFLQAMQVLCVDDWVEVEEDLSVGHCSEGGAGMVLNIVDGRANVKYIMGGRIEKNVSTSHGNDSDAVPWSEGNNPLVV
jgi:hypothetical protein